MNRFVNIGAYQVLWFSLVLGAGQGLDWLGPILLLAWLPLHLQLTDSPAKDFRLFGVFILVGPLLDTAFIQAGLVSYQGAAPVQGFAPYWIIAMWGTFALTLRHSMRWVLSRPLITLAFGVAGGPIAYLAGARLGAAELGAPMGATLAAIAVGWGLLMLLMRLPAHHKSIGVPA